MLVVVSCFTGATGFCSFSLFTAAAGMCSNPLTLIYFSRIFFAMVSPPLPQQKHPTRMRKINISTPVLPQAASPTLGRSTRWAAAPQAGGAEDQVLSPFAITSLSSSCKFSVRVLSATICNLACANKRWYEPGWSIPWVSICTWRGCEPPALWFGVSPCPWTAVWAGYILWHVNSTWWSLMQSSHLCCQEGRVWFLC